MTKGYAAILQALISFLYISLILSCTSLQDEPELEDLDEVSLSPVTVYKLSQGSVKLSGHYKHVSIIWRQCALKSSKGLFILAPESRGVFDCKTPVAQAFLNQGWSVVGVQSQVRGKIQVSPDLGGEMTVKALRKLVDQKKWQPSGLWAYGLPSIEIMQLSRLLKSQYLIVGAGVFDLEQYMAQLSAGEAKKVITAILKREGDDGLDPRSVAWDPSGLPKNVVLYQREKHPLVHRTDVLNFAGQVKTMGSQVVTLFLPEEVKELSDRLHGKVLYKLLEDHVRPAKVMSQTGR